MATYHTQDHSVCGSLEDINPNDGANIKACFVYVGVGGDLKVIAAGDTTPYTLKNVPTGTLLPIKVTRVYFNGTTASALLAVR